MDFILITVKFRTAHLYGAGLQYKWDESNEGDPIILNKWLGTSTIVKYPLFFKGTFDDGLESSKNPHI